MKLKILLTASLLNVLAYAFWGPLFTAYAVHIGASASLAGSLFAFYAFTHALSILFFGKLDNKNTRLRNIIIGYVVQGICAFLFISILDPILLSIPLFLSASAGGMIAPAWKALYTKVLTKDKEGTEWSYFDSGIYFTTSLGTFLAGSISFYFGYRAMFVPLLFINLVSAGIIILNRKHFKDL